MKITLTELFAILDQRALLAALLIERTRLQQEITDLLAGDAALAAKAAAAFAKAEALEAKARAGLPP